MADRLDDEYDGDPCPACGELPQWCSGHSKTYDSVGYAKLVAAGWIEDDDD